MRAIISEKYGQPTALKLSETSIPTLKENQVLVKVHASSINYGNFVLVTGKPMIARLAYGVMKPKYPIPGGDMAGTVVAIGESTSQFQVGDEVYGDLSSCGWGAFAEYVAVDEKQLAVKPHNFTLKEAAAVPMAATTALQAIRDNGQLQEGQEVLIVGASGGVGTFAIQIAKAFGAIVTAVVSTRNVEMAKSLGADYVIDYKKEQLAVNKHTYDLIIGVNGANSIMIYQRLLKENGRYVNIGGAVSQLFQTMLLGPLFSIRGKKKFMTFMQKSSQQDLIFLNSLIEEGKVKSIIDKSYSLEKVPEAFEYFAKGHSQGKVIITI